MTSCRCPAVWRHGRYLSRHLSGGTGSREVAGAQFNESCRCTGRCCSTVCRLAPKPHLAEVVDAPGVHLSIPAGRHDESCPLASCNLVHISKSGRNKYVALQSDEQLRVVRSRQTERAPGEQQVVEGAAGHLGDVNRALHLSRPPIHLECSSGFVSTCSALEEEQAGMREAANSGTKPHLKLEEAPWLSPSPHLHLRANVGVNLRCKGQDAQACWQTAVGSAQTKSESQAAQGASLGVAPQCSTLQADI